MSVDRGVCVRLVCPACTGLALLVLGRGAAPLPVGDTAPAAGVVASTFALVVAAGLSCGYAWGFAKLAQLSRLACSSTGLSVAPTTAAWSRWPQGLHVFELVLQLQSIATPLSLILFALDWQEAAAVGAFHHFSLLACVSAVAAATSDVVTVHALRHLTCVAALAVMVSIDVIVEWLGCAALWMSGDLGCPPRSAAVANAVALVGAVLVVTAKSHRGTYV